CWLAQSLDRRGPCCVALAAQLGRERIALGREFLEREPVQARDALVWRRGHSPTIGGTVKRPTRPTAAIARPKPPAPQPKRAAENSSSPTSTKRSSRPNTGLTCGTCARNGE